MPVGVKKINKRRFLGFSNKQSTKFFTFEHKTTQSGHKMPIWMKKIGKRRF